MNNTSNSSNPSDHHMEVSSIIHFNIIFICLSVVGILIVAANGLVFVLVYKRRTLLRKTNFFLISLAVSDISSGLIGIPLIILCNTYPYESLIKTMDICNKFLGISTILHLLSATIERYIKVLAPLHYRRLVTKKRIVMVLAGIWMISLLTPVIELSWYEDIEATQKYSLALLCCFVIFPLTLMTSITFHIFYLIREQKSRLKILANRTMAKKQQRRKQAERRAVMVYSAMSISFAIGWFPYFLSALFSDYVLKEDDEYPIPVWADYVFLFLKFSTGLIDPLLYTFFKTDFQTAMRSLLFNSYENINTRVTIHMSSLQAPNTQRSSSD
ncbi:histamine H2 receptor-like [Actinia tenebrosa]|uniref:Histamine H2 receptor-like n=1 Tax=Actinia tenebrosa TaxID=6105 RepID=A0A6P8HRC0_ACTTE|nr:histamine H2 receptor-like [Actinia tenebrosa]XP_031558919.1 histamine H2 receptor-like [Actinia tenebrosa]